MIAYKAFPRAGKAFALAAINPTLPVRGLRGALGGGWPTDQADCIWKSGFGGIVGGEDSASVLALILLLEQMPRPRLEAGREERICEQRRDALPAFLPCLRVGPARVAAQLYREAGFHRSRCSHPARWLAGKIH